MQFHFVKSNTDHDDEPDEFNPDPSHPSEGIAEWEQYTRGNMDIHYCSAKGG
jgi:hypothetical protein